MTLDELRVMVERGRAWRSKPADGSERSRELAESQRRAGERLLALLDVLERFVPAYAGDVSLHDGTSVTRSDEEEIVCWLLRGTTTHPDDELAPAAPAAPAAPMVN